MSREAMQQALDAIEGSGCKADLMAAADALRAALENEFNPDWDQVGALQEALREHMAEIHRLRAALAEQDDDLTAAWMAGAAEERKRAEQAQPVAWRYKPMDGSPWWSLSEDGYYVSCKRDNGYIVQPLYPTPPAPQSLRDLCAAAYQVVGVADGPVEMLDNLWAAAEGKPLPHDPGAGLPWSPPSPQPLTDEDIKLLSTRIDKHTPLNEGKRLFARAVEAEVLKRVGVGK